MKIAVTYENGNVFQHFGHSEAFKVYDVEDQLIMGTEVIESEGQGHSFLARKLLDNEIDVVICGGIGNGAMDALNAAGIAVVAGASGDADEAVRAYLRGELSSTGVNCDHHHGEHHCGSDCGSCGGNCGGGCGMNHTEMIGKNVGKTCRTHYRGTFNDGTQFDSSYDRGEPLEFVCGAGMMIQGYDRAVANMNVGESVDIHLMPEEAYGPVDPNAILKAEIKKLPGAENLEVGQKVYLSGAYGQPIPVVVTAKDEETITLDANHEMAGKELNFHIELVEVLDA